MRHVLFALAPLALVGCAHTQHRPIVAEVASASAPCPRDPLIVVDGVAQPSGCDAKQRQPAAECGAGAPIYVVDGIRSCRKP